MKLTFGVQGLVRHDIDPVEILRLPLGGHQDESADGDRDGGAGRAQHAAEQDEQHPGGGKEEVCTPTVGGGQEGRLLHVPHENAEEQGSPIMIAGGKVKVKVAVKNVSSTSPTRARKSREARY